MSGDLRIGVDIGGTFTDVVVRRPGAPSRIMKIPTTRSDPSIAVLEALKRMQAEWGLAPQDVARFVHGTTVATNAVLERKGAKVGVITTEGFRDVLEIGRQMRHQMYELALDPETPTFLAPGRMRREVPERISATGEVLKPLDEAAVADAADALVAAGARGDRGRVPVLVPRRHARAARARDHPARAIPTCSSRCRRRSIRRSANTSAPSSPPSTPT